MEKEKTSRKRKPRSEEQEQVKAFRAACPRHVVEFETDLDMDGCRHAAAMADDLRQAGNRMAGILKKNYSQMARTRAYRSLKKQYGELSSRMSRLDKESASYKKLDKERKQVGRSMTDM